MTPEGKIEQAFVDHCKAHGWMVRKVQWIGRVGAPDRVVIMPGGRVVWVELKRPGVQRLRPGQRREAERLHALGATFRVINSLDDVRAFA